MRHVIIMIVGVIAGSLFFQYVNHAHSAEPKKDVDKQGMVCISNAELDKIMVEKGYDVMLTMTNNDGVVESLWTAGQSISITASVPGQDKSCLLAMMKDVTFNPKAIEEIWETYKKQTKQKDI